MSERKTRVRFAPSPTGPLHIGGVRTALFNYLYAKSQGGDFILRIEDTDKTRYVEGAQEYIIKALEWCGLTPDEGPHIGGDTGPYRQSERKALYGKYAAKLVEDGYGYYAFDTPEELDAMRQRLKAAKVAVPQYNAVTRSTMTNSLTLSDDEVEKRLKNGEPYVIRIKVPRKEEIRVQDIIRGWVVVHSSKVDDKVLFKSDGMPTYHLANVVDDYLMNITHVIRGEEWLPSTPIHVLLYKYLGWEEAMPQFSHLPLLLRPDGNGKLSKRDGDRLGFPVFPMDWTDPKSGEKSSGYKEQGYFREAFINMLAFLGWNPGTTEELFSLDELIGSFTLERVGKAGAKFDLEKAHWYNQRYLREKPDAELAVLLQPYLAKAGIVADSNYVAKVCNLMKERATFIPDMMEGAYFFNPPREYDTKMIRKKWKDNTPSMIEGFRDKLSSMSDFSSANIDMEFKAYLESNDISMGEIMPILRILIAGVTSGPSIFDVISVIGKQEALNRIEVGLEKIPALSIA